MSMWDDFTGWLSDSDIDWGGIGAAGLGGLLGLTGGGSSSGSSAPTGYQGGIPRYTASREVLPVSDQDRRPGGAGRYYFGDIVYTPMESTAAPATDSGIATLPAENNNIESNLYENANTLGNENAAGGLIKMAGGGLTTLGSYSDGGQMLKGPGTGQSDDIPATIEGEQPARLARDEFVIPADVVSMLGDGSSDAGAERLYAMMDRIRKAAHGKEQQQKQINPKQVLPA